MQRSISPLRTKLLGMAGPLQTLEATIDAALRLHRSRPLTGQSRAKTPTFPKAKSIASLPIGSQLETASLPVHFKCSIDLFEQAFCINGSALGQVTDLCPAVKVPQHLFENVLLLEVAPLTSLQGDLNAFGN